MPAFQIYSAQVEMFVCSVIMSVWWEKGGGGGGYDAGYFYVILKEDTIVYQVAQDYGSFPLVQRSIDVKTDRNGSCAV